MMMHIKMLCWALDVACGNVGEAEKYAEKAHHFREQHKAAADWCAEMAKRHLEFNDKGASLMDQLCRELGETKIGGEMMEAFKAMVHEKRGHLAERTAKVKMSLGMYER